MFKIIRVQAVRLASLCAILFMASSYLVSRQTVQTVNCFSNDQIATNESFRHHQRPSTTSSHVSTSPRAPVTNSDHVDGTKATLVAPVQRESLSHLEATESRVQKGTRAQPVGKILDYTKNESRRRYHSLIPRRLNSTALLRLVAAPFQSKSSHADHERSRAPSSQRNDEEEGKHGEANVKLDSQNKRIDETSRTEGKFVAQRQSRSFGGVLRGARDLLTSGISSIEQRAGSILYLGSNLLAALIPLASLIGFGSVSSHSPDSTTAAANATATPSRGGVASLIAPPQKLVQYAASFGGVQSRVEHVMDWLERSIEHLPNFPHLHPQECVKRSICEAHNEPDKYGALGLTLRLLFPATNFSGPTSEQDNMDFKVINKYRHAAGYGLSRRLYSTQTNSTNSNYWPNSGACKEKYEDCLVSLLDVAQKLVDLFVS